VQYLKKRFQALAEIGVDGSGGGGGSSSAGGGVQRKSSLLVNKNDYARKASMSLDEVAAAVLRSRGAVTAKTPGKEGKEEFERREKEERTREKRELCMVGVGWDYEIDWSAGVPGGVHLLDNTALHDSLRDEVSGLLGGMAPSVVIDPDPYILFADLYLSLSLHLYLSLSLHFYLSLSLHLYLSLSLHLYLSLSLHLYLSLSLHLYLSLSISPSLSLSISPSLSHSLGATSINRGGHSALNPLLSQEQLCG
jgi:hypothetical protein